MSGPWATVSLLVRRGSGWERSMDQAVGLLHWSDCLLIVYRCALYQCTSLRAVDGPGGGTVC